MNRIKIKENDFRRKINEMKERERKSAYLNTRKLHQFCTVLSNKCWLARNKSQLRTACSQLEKPDLFRTLGVRCSSRQTAWNSCRQNPDQSNPAKAHFYMQISRSLLLYSLPNWKSIQINMS